MCTAEFSRMELLRLFVFVGAQNGGKKKKKKMYIFLKALGVGKFFLLLFVCLEFLG